MNKEQLLATDSYYDSHIDTWQYLQAAYDGAKALVEYGILEGFKEPEQYKKNGAVYGYEYTSRINKILTGFIANSKFINDYGKLSDDEMFQNFMQDCDLYGTDFNLWFNERREVVSYMGHIGIVVDMPVEPTGEGNLQAQKDLGIYPYLSSYDPVNILEMQISRNPQTNRPFFSKVKLREYNPDRVIILTPEKIEKYSIPIEDDEEAEQLNAGNDINKLGVIPFFLFINDKKPGTLETKSSVRGIADIDVSLIKDGLKSEKVLFNAAFPALVMAADRDDPTLSEQTMEKGVNQLLTETPETKGIHRWISSEAWSAIQPILASTDDKRREIYLMANLGAILQSTSNEARSGESLKQSFRYLEGSLARMVSNELEARRNVFRYWLLWLNRLDEFQEISIGHDGDFDIESMISSMDDILVEQSLLQASPTAQKELSKKIVNIGTLKTLDLSTISIINDEIDNFKIGLDENIQNETSQ